MKVTGNEYLAIQIGRKIIEEVGEPAKLKGKYLKLFKEYIKRIEEDKKYVDKEFKEDSDIRNDAISELDDEILYIECFCRWLQEEKKALLN